MTHSTLLKVSGLKQYFPIKGGFFGGKVNDVKAVDDISFEVNEGETVSIVGNRDAENQRQGVPYFDLKHRQQEKLYLMAPI